MRYLTPIGAASVVVLVLGGLSLHIAKADDDDHESSRGDEVRIQQGYRIAPVSLNLRGKNRALVGLGSYLVNAVGGCNDCHTNPSFAPGGDPYLGQPKRINMAGYLGGGQTFGPFVSRNLTPENGLPAGRTYAEFVDIMRHGTDYDHLHPQISPLLQVMPWPTYQDMTDHDLRAIYEYLKAIPPIAPPDAKTP